MPQYKTNRKKGKKSQYRKPKQYKKSYPKKYEMIMYNPRSGGVPFPARYFTKMSSVLIGNVKSAQLAAGELNLPIKLNSVYLPFQSFPSAGTVYVITNLNTGDFRPPGFDNLCNVRMYSEFRVLASSVDVSIQPESQLDPIICTVTPSDNAFFPSSLPTAMGQKYTKLGQFSIGSDPIISDITGKRRPLADSLKLYMKPHILGGFPKKALDYDLSGQFTGGYETDPGILYYYNVKIKTLSDASTTQVVPFRITCTWYVELFGFDDAQF